QRRAMEHERLPPGELAQHALENRTRQMVRARLQVVQVDVQRLLIVEGPATQTCQHVTLADPGLPEEQDTEAALRLEGFPGQRRQALERGLVNRRRVEEVRGRAAGAIVGERVTRLDGRKEIIQLAHAPIRVKRKVHRKASSR